MWAQTKRPFGCCPPFGPFRIDRWWTRPWPTFSAAGINGRSECYIGQVDQAPFSLQCKLRHHHWSCAVLLGTHLGPSLRCLSVRWSCREIASSWNSLNRSPTQPPESKPVKAIGSCLIGLLSSLFSIRLAASKPCVAETWDPHQGWWPMVALTYFRGL